MLALVEAFLQIALRRRGPEDLPDSQFLLAIALAGYVAAQLPIAVLLFGWSGPALLAVVADAALLAGFFWLPLWYTGRLSRYRRTLTALAGTGALLALPQAPLVLASRMAQEAGAIPALPTVGLLALLAWTIVVQAHVASRALSTGFGIGLAIALGYFIISYQVTGQIAPATTG
jgi:hypothetical protein